MSKRQSWPRIVRTWRGKRTRPQAAKILGVSLSAIEHWEYGRRRPATIAEAELRRRMAEAAA